MTRIIIDHELYGERSIFNSLAEAQAAIRLCGGDFAETELSISGTNVVDEHNNIIGEIEA